MKEDSNNILNRSTLSPTHRVKLIFEIKNHFQLGIHGRMTVKTITKDFFERT